MTVPPDEIVVFGTRWCYDTTRALRWLDNHQIVYRYIDIDHDPEASALVERVNHGFRSVPTIFFPDGSRLVEPTSLQLAEKFGIA